MDLLEQVKWNDDGLVPAIVQDAEDDQVLMVAWMNRDALRQTLETRKVTFWSRSRQKFWVKGETSGHFQHLVELRADCDADCLLVRVRQEGAACHAGYRSCFFRAVDEEGRLAVVEERRVDPDDVYARR